MPGMLTHFGNFLCSIAGKGSFKTDLSLWRTALNEREFFNAVNHRFATSCTGSLNKFKSPRNCINALERYGIYYTI